MEGLGAGRTEAQVSRENEAPRGGYLWEASAVRLGPPLPSPGLSPLICEAGDISRGRGLRLGCPRLVSLSQDQAPLHPPRSPPAPRHPSSLAHVCKEQSPAPNTPPVPPGHALLYCGASMGCTLRSGWPGRGGDGPGVGGREPGHPTAAGRGQGCALARSLPGPVLGSRGAAQVRTMTLSRHASSRHSNFGRRRTKAASSLLGWIDQQPRPPPGRPPGAEAGRPARHLLPMWPGHGHPRDPPPS